MIERVLIAGHGSIGKRHLRIARESLPNADIRVLRRELTSTIPDLANGCFSDLECACNFRPQVSVIANPAPFHIRTGMALGSMGSHLLVEKPLSDSREGVQELIDLMYDRRLVLQVGYNLRFLRSIERFREMLFEGAIGRVLSVRCEAGQYLPCWRPEVDYRIGVSARRDLGGGVLTELSHELDYLAWLFGEVHWVCSWLGQTSDLEIDVEDTAHLLLGFAQGTDGKSPTAALTLDFVRQDPVRLCTAVGEKGSLRWNGISGTVDLYCPGSDGWRQVFHKSYHRDESYRSQWGDFLHCVQSGDWPRVSGEDGLRVVSVIEAARVSAKARGVKTGIEPTKEPHSR